MNDQVKNLISMDVSIVHIGDGKIPSYQTARNRQNLAEYYRRKADMLTRGYVMPTERRETFPDGVKRRTEYRHSCFFEKVARAVLGRFKGDSDSVQIPEKLHGKA